MGLAKKYTSLGYNFRYSGRALDVDLETTSKYLLVKQFTEELKAFLDNPLEFVKEKIIDPVKSTTISASEKLRIRLKGG
jgi:hypothetical protein